MSKIRVGVIGVGRVAWIGHLPWYKENPVVELVAVADVDEHKARKAAEYFHIPYFYTDYEKLVSRKDIDAVSICTPVHLHTEQTVRAAEEGKHVLVEKPMARDIYECDEMIRVCEKAGVVLMVGFMKRFNPGFQKIKKLLDEGTLGKPHFMEVHWSLFDIKGTEAFRYKAYTGGGIFQDHGSHYIDLFRWWTGDEVSEVTAECNLIVPGRQVEDHAVVLLRFKRGSVAVIETSRVGPSHEQYGLWERGQIYCTKGAILFDVPDWISYELPLIKVFKRGTWETLTMYKEGRYPPKHYMFKREIDHFIECIKCGKKPLVTGYDGRAAIEVINAAYLSQIEGRKIKLPLKGFKIREDIFKHFPVFRD